MAGYSHQRGLRDPKKVQAWLVGSGIASLAAAVHLIKDANVPASQIHILQGQSQSVGEVETAGNHETGYNLHVDLQPYFGDPCVEDLLSLVPHPVDQGKTLFDIIKDKKKTQETPSNAWTHILVQGRSAPEKLDTGSLHLGLKDRLDLVRIMFGNETKLEGKSIREVFDTPFFQSKFWIFWSTTFAIQSWHSAVEFRRHLCKYSQQIHSLHNANIFGQFQDTMIDSILQPISEFLRMEGVDFQLEVKVNELKTQSDSNEWMTISEIQVIDEDGNDTTIFVEPEDVVIATFGPIASHALLGSNSSPPLTHSRMPETVISDDDWSLWFKMAEKGPTFGDPLNFYKRLWESTLETFTITLKNSAFIELYMQLTRDEPGPGAFMFLADSNWRLTINVPKQPVVPGQPDNIHVVWGYALSSSEDGNFVKKPMSHCSGEEIMVELLSHLQFPLESIIPTSTTIPCLLPQATSSMLTRTHSDRPEVAPPRTTNLAIIGQFVEIPDHATFSMEYSVRGSQMAVYELMGLTKVPINTKRSHLLETLDLFV